MRRIQCFLTSMLIFFSSAVYAECSFKQSYYLSELDQFKSIKSIKIELNNHRAFTRNALKVIADRAWIIQDKYKKKFRASIEVQYNFGSCVYDGRVRLSGDMKDHVKLIDSNYLSTSLDVKLDQGSILGVTRFKLFIPEARNAEDEILATEVLRELDYIAPRTSYVRAVVNGHASQYLFQEKARKELLEGAFRREGPIFEGDESISWGKNGFEKTTQGMSLARMENTNWSLKGETSAKISLRAYEKLQLITS